MGLSVWGKWEIETQEEDVKRTRLALLLVFGMLAALLPVGALPAAATSHVFINEIHYDNAGGDTGEFVEVAGTAGTNLSDWSIVLYNGNGGGFYDTINLSGTIPDQQDGFGTVSFSESGIQNGSPDGLALLDGTTVVEFLSYEGSLDATNGPANGMTSTDIGVSEPGSTPIGSSLQLTGAGTMVGDFTWSGPTAETPGAVNTGQTFGQPVVVSCPGVLALHEGDSASLQITATDANSQASWSTVIVAPADPGITVDVLGLPDEVGQVAVAEIAVSDSVAAGSYTVDASAVSTDGSTASCSFDILVLTITKIHDVQGPGSTTPLDGTVVAIEGVVVGDFQEFNEFFGFWVQEELSDQDSDQMTSEGIMVNSTSPVEVGDVVRVIGEADESGGNTRLTNVSSVEVVGSNSEDLAEVVSLPVSPTNDLEWYEGMLVTFPQDLYISEYFNYDRFGEIVLTTSRQFQPTEVFEPGSSAADDLADANQASRITLDDGSRFQNPDFNRHPDGTEFTLENTFRGGDVVVNVTGVVDYAFGNYKIQPTTGADYMPANPRPTKDAKVKGQIRVASFNVLNFFTTIDEGPNVCGPTGLSDCRGADSQEEYDRQLAKLLAGIQALDADVIGFQEVESGVRDVNGVPAHDAILTIVDELNAIPGAGQWAWVGEPVLGDGTTVHYNDYPVRNEIIYRMNVVKPVGPAMTIADDDFDGFRPGDFEPLGRPPVAQTFAKAAAGEPNKVFTVVVNHLKSKGSSCSSIGDPFDPNGQGNCNLTRVAQANALLQFVGSLQDWSGDDDVLIIGDLNSYGMEDPGRSDQSRGLHRLT